MADTVGLTMGELDRLQIVTRIAERRLTRRKAAALLGLSKRQLHRLYRRFTDAGVAHHPSPMTTLLCGASYTVPSGPSALRDALRTLASWCGPRVRGTSTPTAAEPGDENGSDESSHDKGPVSR